MKDLNLRFGDWYFVVSNDTFQKVRLSRDDVIKKKGAPGEPASAGGQNSPAGAPGTAIPGLPSLPRRPQLTMHGRAIYATASLPRPFRGATRA